MLPAFSISHYFVFLLINISLTIFPTDKAHMLIASHLRHFLDTFGPLWDYGCATMEASGRQLKKFYLSTNRHAADYCEQLCKRYQESFWLQRVLPRHLLARLSTASPQPAQRDPLLSTSSTGPLRLSASAAKVLLVDASFCGAWTAFETRAGAGAVQPLDQYQLTFFSRAHIKRHSKWRRVCDASLKPGDVIQVYEQPPGSPMPLSRERHIHILQPVATVSLLSPIVFFYRH